MLMSLYQFFGEWFTIFSPLVKILNNLSVSSRICKKIVLHQNKHFYIYQFLDHKRFLPTVFHIEPEGHLQKLVLGFRRRDFFRYKAKKMWFYSVKLIFFQ